MHTCTWTNTYIYAYFPDVRIMNIVPKMNVQLKRRPSQRPRPRQRQRLRAQMGSHDADSFGSNVCATWMGIWLFVSLGLRSDGEGVECGRMCRDWVSKPLMRLVLIMCKRALLTDSTYSLGRLCADERQPPQTTEPTGWPKRVPWIRGANIWCTGYDSEARSAFDFSWTTPLSG